MTAFLTLRTYLKLDERVLITPFITFNVVRFVLPQFPRNNVNPLFFASIKSDLDNVQCVL